MPFTKKLVFLAVLIALIPWSQSTAGALENQMRSRWLGAWVVVTSEMTSDCSVSYTNNTVNGRLVSGKGAFRFAPGELAKITKLDLKRSRLDVFVELDEPLLISYPEGPFELYREARCRAELLIEVPRSMVKQKDVEGTEGLVLQVMERHATRDEVTASDAWNQRERDPYPEDYEETLAALEVWRVEEQNTRIRARIEEAREEVRRTLARVSTEKEGYAAGFALGIGVMMSREFGDCDRLVGSSFKNYREKAPDEYLEEGFHDGQLLAYSVEMMNRLEECYIEVP